MLDFVKDALNSPAGSFAFIFAFIVLAFWACHWVTRKLTRINMEHDRLTHNINSTMGNIDEIRRDLSYIKGSIDIMQRHISDGYTQKYSPISLTEKGKEEVSRNHLDLLVDRNWDTIYRLMDKEVESKNPYDIQSFCLETAATEPKKLFVDSDVALIKELAFKNGLALMTYTNILGILIRDKYFKQKGINVEKVDKHDPHIKNKHSSPL